MFDFDGTLVDTAPDIAHHANVVLERRGCPQKSLDEVKQGVGWGVHELLRSLSPGFAWTTQSLDDAVFEFKELYAAKPVLYTKVYPGVLDMLSGPLARFPKAILTNKPHGLTVAILQEMGLSDFFEQVLGEGNGFPKKPDPTGARYLIQKAKTLPEHAVLVGDSHIDWETALNAQTGFVWMDYGYDKRLKENPSVIRLSSALGWADLWGRGKVV